MVQEKNYLLLNYCKLWSYHKFKSLRILLPISIISPLLRNPTPIVIVEYIYMILELQHTHKKNSIRKWKWRAKVPFLLHLFSSVYDKCPIKKNSVLTKMDIRHYIQHVSEHFLMQSIARSITCTHIYTSKMMMMIKFNGWITDESFTEDFFSLLVSFNMRVSLFFYYDSRWCCAKKYESFETLLILVVLSQQQQRPIFLDK